MPGADHQVDDVLRGGAGTAMHGDADAFAPRDLLEIADVVDRHAAARLLADFSLSVSNSAAISNPSCRKPG